MLFNALEFLLLFLPVVLVLSRWTCRQAFIAVMALVSVVFYAFTGELWFLLPMFFTSVLDYGIGLCMEKARDQLTRRTYLG
jgi:hypothetical protein